MSREKDPITKKRDRRRAYLNDFKQDERGTYVYRGNVYDYVDDAHSLRSVKVRLSLLGVLMLLALILSGVIQTPGMDHSAYLLIPYAAGLCGSVSVCWALLRLDLGRPPLREYIYQETIAKLPARAAFTACCCIIALVGEPVYLFSHGFDMNGIGSFLFPVLQGIALAAALLLRTGVLQMKWTTHNETATK